MISDRNLWTITGMESSTSTLSIMCELKSIHSARVSRQKCEIVVGWPAGSLLFLQYEKNTLLHIITMANFLIPFKGIF